MSLLGRLTAGGGVFAHVPATLDALRLGAGEVRVLRFSTPPPTMAFSRRDQLSAHFVEAAAAVEAAGFRAEVRPVGGSFAPLHRGSLVVEEFGRSSTLDSPSLRFDRHVGIVAEVLHTLGVEARVGEIDGEYCPGRYSVNAGGRIKISGTAQRVSGSAWLVSTVVQVADAEALRAVTARCAEIMRTPLDVDTIGSLHDEVGPVDARGLARRIAAAFRSRGLLRPSSVLNTARPLE